ncbi:hypothetical protein [Lactobacillus gasseri]|uniref:hypothetical protein n=1 Tax=Lactobacillus gasseri TaxID=1596 RepID=UPI00237E8FB9|nr:hypothetical protein [Lactobacillus gasseri]
MLSIIIGIERLNTYRTALHIKSGYTADKLHTGDTDVGFEGKYYDFLAKIINNGKHKMSDKE